MNGWNFCSFIYIYISFYPVLLENEWYICIPMSLIALLFSRFCMMLVPFSLIFVFNLWSSFFLWNINYILLGSKKKKEKEMEIRWLILKLGFLVLILLIIDVVFTIYLFKCGILHWFKRIRAWEENRFGIVNSQFTQNGFSFFEVTLVW